MPVTVRYLEERLKVDRLDTLKLSRKCRDINVPSRL